MRKIKDIILFIITNLPKPLVIFVINILNWIGKKANFISFTLNVNSLQIPKVKEWHKIKGDETLRIEYPLKENSVVFDVGGFIGEWSSLIFLKYLPTIHIFEPVSDSVQHLKKKFGSNPKIKIHQFGLSGNNQSAQICLGSHAASIFNIDKNSGFQNIQLVKMSDFLKKEKINHIDLMKINIEGGEYELLEHMIESGIVKITNNIQIQFHNFIPNAEDRMKKIQSQLSKTHYLTYQYKFVWENWQKR